MQHHVGLWVIHEDVDEARYFFTRVDIPGLFLEVIEEESRFVIEHATFPKPTSQDKREQLSLDALHAFIEWDSRLACCEYPLSLC